MDSERFKGINFLPDPVAGSDNHYVPFADMYGIDTSDNERPSLTQRRNMKTLTYSPSEQHARNVFFSGSAVLVGMDGRYIYIHTDMMTGRQAGRQTC